MEQERERLGSRLGFILISAGCAIGIGNVWKFPYMTGKGGGGIFVLLYLIFLVLLGLPILSMEFSIGRAARKSPVLAYQKLEPKGTKWHIHGIIALIGNYLLMMFYTTVSGWMLHYFYLTITGKFDGLDTTGVNQVFNTMLSQPKIMIFWMILVVIVGMLIVSTGLESGLENITKVVMVTLLVVMVILAINSFFLKGAAEGLKYYLVPNIQRIEETGLGNVITGAMNQAFFTLSLGIGAMLIFGSYISNDRSMLGESVTIVILDTFVAIVSGLIIFPATFTYGVDQTSGPALIFITLPNIFNKIHLGRLWGSLFFIFMSFAAFSTVLAVFENIVSCGMDLTKKSRKQVSLWNMIFIILLSLPCIFGFNIWKFDWLKVFGGSILDLEDFLVSNILLPLGSLVYLLFCVSRYGWGWDNYLKETNTGKGLKMKNWMRFYLTYILPLIVLFIFAFGIYDKFK